MKISLFDFIQTGQFGSVSVGQSMEFVSANFPSPDSVSDMGDDMFIWQYGVFEFHFSAGELVLLWCDNLDYLGNPDHKQFVLDRWIFQKSKDMTLALFCNTLDQHQIKYHLNGTFFQSRDQGLPDNVILTVDNTETVVYFENTNETATSVSSYLLIAIGASPTKSRYNTHPL